MPGISDIANPTALRFVTGAYTMTPLDSVIFASRTGAYTVTLLPATAVPGAQVTVAADTAGANLITVSGGGTNIDGAATDVTLLGTATFHALTLVSNGTIWRRVSFV